jgi:hypothetical protein
MKIKVISQDRLVEIEVEGETLKDAWAPLAAVQEVLADTKCEACDSTRVRFDLRTPKGYVFRSLTCMDCGARLEFGETKEGGRLFPKRKDKDGNDLINHGWVRWQPEYQAPAAEPVDDKSIPF